MNLILYYFLALLVPYPFRPNKGLRPFGLIKAKKNGKVSPGGTNRRERETKTQVGYLGYYLYSHIANL